jgi:hypothetical protein
VKQKTIDRNQVIDAHNYMHFFVTISKSERYGTLESQHSSMKRRVLEDTKWQQTTLCNGDQHSSKYALLPSTTSWKLAEHGQQHQAGLPLLPSNNSVQ